MAMGYAEGVKIVTLDQQIKIIGKFVCTSFDICIYTWEKYYKILYLLLSKI